MDPDETDTPLDSGTESVTPESDTAEDWDYFDPEEDTEEAPEAEATDEGTEEPTEEEAEPEAPAQISLPDGTQVTLDEAVKGYLRQSDYTRKSTELASKRQSLDADLQLVEGMVQTFVDHLTSMVPQPPDPAMALRNPNAYVAAKAQYDAAMAQVQKLIEIGKAPKEIKGKLSSEDQRATMAAENARLIERFPMAATPEGRTKFMESAATAAQEAGFSMDDLKGVSDHRLFVLAHWANEGLKAAKARETAKAKVATAAPVAPKKPGQPVQANRNADAMRKLSRSGSIRDAMRVDWE